MSWFSVLKKDELEKKGLSWFAKGNNPKKFLLDRDGVRHAAGAAVFKGDKILIVERSPEEDSMIGMWEFAGGKIEEVDEFNEDGTPDAEKVCMIEVGEELGLKVKPTSKLGVHFDKNMTPPKKYHCFRIEVGEDWNPTLSFEHSDFKWISLEELKEYPDNKLSHHVRYLINKL
jgi:8-oxo-dGTP pyrophosphatase MutT (NUDIX family)